MGTHAGAVVALVGGPLGRRVAELVGRGRRLLIASLPEGATAEALIARAGWNLRGARRDGVRRGRRARKPAGAQKAGACPPADRRLLKKGERAGRPPGDRRACSASAMRSAPTTLAGAQEAGFYKSLWAEYRRCRSKTVDFAAAGFTPEDAAAAIGRELDRHDGPSELGYVGGKRMARVVERVPLGVPRLGSERDAVALITGGTGEIGLALARDLVGRGFRALLLTGRREFTPEQQRIVDGLARQGASIAFFRGDLCDEAALGASIEDFRAAHGRITHVYHCAGAVSRVAPAFFQKTAASMAEVMQPKVDALWVLHRLLASAPPQVFMLFSSVSAVAPKLASGLLDYAAREPVSRPVRAVPARARSPLLPVGAMDPMAADGTRARRSETVARRDWRSTRSSVSRRSIASQQLESWGPSSAWRAAGEPALAAEALERPAVAEEDGPSATAASSADSDGGFDVVRREVRAIVAKELENRGEQARRRGGLRGSGDRLHRSRRRGRARSSSGSARKSTRAS